MSQTAIQNAGGGGSLFTGALLWVINQVHLADINSLLITMTTLGGLVWLFFKVRGTILSNKGTELDNEIKRKQIEKDSTNSPN
jgi:hypothetical protein